MELIQAAKAKELSKANREILVSRAVEKLWREVKAEIEDGIASGLSYGYVEISGEIEREAFESIEPFLEAAGYKVAYSGEYQKISW